MAAPRGRLIIICGLPGSGKTTRAEALVQRHGGTRFSPDDWMEALALDLWDQDRRRRIEKLQWRVASEVLRAEGTAIVEWGTWWRAERDALRIAARELGAAVELIYLTAEPAVLYERIHRRGREVPPITREMIEEWSRAFEAPGDDEAALFDAPQEDRPA